MQHTLGKRLSTQPRLKNTDSSQATESSNPQVRALMGSSAEKMAARVVNKHITAHTLHHSPPGEGGGSHALTTQPLTRLKKGVTKCNSKSWEEYRTYAPCGRPSGQPSRALVRGRHSLGFLARIPAAPRAPVVSLAGPHTDRRLRDTHGSFVCVTVPLQSEPLELPPEGTSPHRGSST